MKKVFKIFGVIMSILIVLSISIKDRPVFDYISIYLVPAVKSGQELIEAFAKKSMSLAKIYSHKIFDNSVPKLKDQVGSKLSSNQKNYSNPPSEEISPAEKSELDQLIKNHR